MCIRDRDYPDKETAIRKVLLDPQGPLIEEPQRLLRDDIDVYKRQLLDGILADAPLVIVDAIHLVAEILGTDWIQSTGDRLLELRLSFAISKMCIRDRYGTMERSAKLPSPARMPET